LLVEGEPGIGKTTLWLAAAQQAREQGFHVLSARAAAAESVLAYGSSGIGADAVAHYASRWGQVLQRFPPQGGAAAGQPPGGLFPGFEEIVRRMGRGSFLGLVSGEIDVLQEKFE
jgi:hypothetical protein